MKTNKIQCSRHVNITNIKLEGMQLKQVSYAYLGTKIIDDGKGIKDINRIEKSKCDLNGNK